MAGCWQFTSIQGKIATRYVFVHECFIVMLFIIVLWAFANYNTEVGYCQGLNRIACLALEHLSEEVIITLIRKSLLHSLIKDSFHFLRLVVSKLLPADYYTKEMKGILADGKLISQILKDKCPKLEQHLRQLGTGFTTFITIFSPTRTIFVIRPRCKYRNHSYQLVACNIYRSVDWYRNHIEDMGCLSLRRK